MSLFLSKLPGVGVSPKTRPRECPAEYGQVPALSEIGEKENASRVSCEEAFECLGTPARLPSLTNAGYHSELTLKTYPVWSFPVIDSRSSTDCATSFAAWRTCLWRFSDYSRGDARRICCDLHFP